MEKRNQINYREREFHDPAAPDFFTNIAEYIGKKSFENRLLEYINDSLFIFCFQPDHAILALPIKCAMEISYEFTSLGIEITPAKGKKEILNHLICDSRSCNMEHCLLAKISDSQV